jgi:DNA-directed RNA polymerase specialized sigma24 family protein
LRVVEGRLDPIIRAAQAGDRGALERLLGALRDPLLRFAQGLGRGLDPEDAVQEALLDVARGIGGYRWEAGFLSWSYAICARRVARQARANAARLAAMADWIEASVTGPPESYAPSEEILLAQHAHLACAFVVANELPPALRRAYLLGEALGVDHRIGAVLCGCTEAAFRQRLSRARRAVREHIQSALQKVPASADQLGILAEELDRLVRLGELSRARPSAANAAATDRAMHLAAPTLADPAVAPPT